MSLRLEFGVTPRTADVLMWYNTIFYRAYTFVNFSRRCIRTDLDLDGPF